MHDKSDIAAAAAKTSPPIAVTGITISGYSISDWVLVATLLYTLLQIAVLIRNQVRQHRRTPECPPKCVSACPPEAGGE